jgi:multiple antibiotic resistance protein
VFIELAKSVVLTISALFPIVNPLGSSPIFLSLTQEYAVSTRRVLARKVAFNSFILLVASFLVGSHILAFFGISIPVVQVGGGLIVISTGWTLLSKKDEQERHGQVQKSVNPLDVFRNAFYPLTLPLTVGPGSISIAITLGANANGPRHFGASLLSIIAAVVGSALVALTVYLCYGFADRLAAILGENGMTIVMRLSSFLLVCIGVQILWNGLSALLQNLAHSLPAISR